MTKQELKNIITNTGAEEFTITSIEELNGVDYKIERFYTIIIDNELEDDTEIQMVKGEYLDVNVVDGDEELQYDFGVFDTELSDKEITVEDYLLQAFNIIKTTRNEFKN